MTESNAKVALFEIRRAIREADKGLRNKHPWLRHQNTIGALLTLGASSGIILCMAGYLLGALTAVPCVVGIALFSSILHELEHDLIHDLYFKKNRKIQNALLCIVWALKPNTVSPWYRKKIHLHHHRVSGSDDDVEERILGNGIPYGWKRLIHMIDPPIGYLYFFRKQLDAIPSFNRWTMARHSLPFYTLYLVTRDLCVLWFVFVLVSAALDRAIPQNAFIDALLVVGLLWVLPNMIRAFCLNFVTSSLHYCGEVNSQLRETQVLNHWIFAPFNLFCFNFGGTHAIHHILVSQPFYLRQMCASRVYGVMQSNGVRFNDFSVFQTANRWT